MPPAQQKFEKSRQQARAASPQSPTPPLSLIDVELEADVIGAVIDDNLQMKYCAFLSPDHFSDKIHAELWDHILRLRQQGKDATLSTLALSLGDSRLESIGGRDFLAQLVIRGMRVKTAINEATERLRDLSQWRRLKSLSYDISSWTETGGLTSDEAISIAIEELKLALAAGGSRARRKSEVAADAITLVTTGSEPVPTGISQLDYLLSGGFMPSRSYAFLAPYGRGKTILLGSVSDNINIQAVNHLFISLETPAEDIEIRTCARRIGLNSAQLYDRDDPLWGSFTQKAANWASGVQDHTWYEFAPGATMDEIERMIIRAVHLFGIKGVILDYWQLVGGKLRNQTTHDHLQDVAGRLAILARKLNIWVAVTAQCDDLGEARDCKTGLHTKFTQVLQLVRGENDDTAHFVTAKSNYSRYATTNDEAAGPTVIFDLAGPHIRSANAADQTMYGNQDAA